MVCPMQSKDNTAMSLFPVTCKSSKFCRERLGANFVCCEGRCVQGVPAPIKHQPLLGFIPRECPSTKYGELLFDVQQCKSDQDCWPRICCPDGQKSYCRTAHQRLDLLPIVNNIEQPFGRVEKYLQYLQCSPPPKIDLFPIKCTTSMDCFPNLCCAEGGKRFCRAPRKSFLTLFGRGGLKFLMNAAAGGRN